MNCKTGIYSAIHRDSGMCYVGSSVNIGVRISTHVACSRRGSNVRFHRALREFGAGAFDFEILEECRRVELLSRERFYIVLLNAASIEGFNVYENPSAQYGMSPSAITRERQRLAKVGRKLSVEHCETLKRANRKKRGPFTEEHRRKLSQAHKTSPKCLAVTKMLHQRAVGKKQSAEHVEKKAAALRGRTRPAHIGIKIAFANMGRKMSTEARKNMRAGWARKKTEKQFSANAETDPNGIGKQDKKPKQKDK